MDTPNTKMAAPSNLRMLNVSRAEDLAPSSPPHTLADDAEVISASSTPNPLTDDEIINTLVANNGILVRAASILGLSVDQILEVVTRNLPKLSTMLRGRLMLSSFVTVLKLDSVLQASADELPLDTLGRTYAASLSAFTNLAAGFEQEQESTDTDDADAVKETMLERLERMGKREAAEQALQQEEAAS